jgi:hypothetical protein
MGAAVAWSVRVLIDTILLLSVSKVLLRTMRAVLPSLLVILAGASLRVIVEPGYLLIALVLPMLLASVVINWRPLREVYIGIVK